MERLNHVKALNIVAKKETSYDFQNVVGFAKYQSILQSPLLYAIRKGHELQLPNDRFANTLRKSFSKRITNL